MRDLIIADLRSNCSYNGISTGHYVPVARMYQQLFKKMCNVKIVGGPVYSKYFDSEDLDLLPFNVSGDSLKHKILLFYNSIYLFLHARGKNIIIQQASDVSVHLAIALFYWGGAKLFLIRYSNTGINTRIKRLIYFFAKRKINGLICPNDEVGQKYGRPYVAIPDYIYTGREIVKANTINKKYDFCIVGRLVEEKGVVEVARWIANKQYSIIIAGNPQTKEIADTLQSISRNSANIILKLGYISDQEYNDILISSRYSMMNYLGEYSRRSSGVVFDTLFAGVPVIGTHCKALEFIAENNVGYLYESLDDLEDKLDELMKEDNRKIFESNIEVYRSLHRCFWDQLVAFVLKTSKLDGNHNIL